MNISSSITAPRATPAGGLDQRETLSFTVASDLAQEGELVRDAFVSMDNVPGLDHDPRPGFVDLQNPRKFYDKAAFTQTEDGGVGSLTLSNTWGSTPSRTWDYSASGSPSTLTVNNPTYFKQDQTIYHFDFGPDTSSWFERKVVMH